MHNDLNELVGRLLGERAQMQAQRDAFAHALVNLERHASALTHHVELAKSQLAGITPTGRSIIAPQPER